MEYTETFRARMVRRMLGPKAVTASALSGEVGIPQPTLSRWLGETATFRTMKEKDKPDAQPPPPPEVGKRAQDWTPKEKLRAVAETASLEGEGLGEYLRRHGLHGEQLTQWRAIAISALQGPVSRRQAKAEGKRVKELERELRRKEKAFPGGEDRSDEVDASVAHHQGHPEGSDLRRLETRAEPKPRRAEISGVIRE